MHGELVKQGISDDFGRDCRPLADGQKSLNRRATHERMRMHPFVFTSVFEWAASADATAERNSVRNLIFDVNKAHQAFVNYK